jgi:WD40 repeat protein
VELDDGVPIAIADLPGRMSAAAGTAWLRDGTIYLTTGGSGIFSVSSQGGDLVTVLEPGEDENDFHDLLGLPDGKSVVFIVHNSESADTLASFDGQERRTLLRIPGQWLRRPAYSASGHLLFQRTTSSVGLWAVPFSSGRYEVTGVPFLVAPGAGSPAVSADGTMAYVLGNASRQRQLTFFDRQGRSISSVGEPQDGLNAPALSPDGTHIAVSAEADGQSDIWIYDVESGTRSRLTFTPEADMQPRWFPDGQRVAFQCEGNTKICIRRADGTGEGEDLSTSVGEALDVSLQSGMLVFDRSGRGTRFDLWYRDLEGEETVFLATPDFESDPRFSRDGSRLAYTAWELGMEEVFMRDFPEGSGKWQVSPSGGGTPAWSDDEIFWLNGTQLWARTFSSPPENRLGPPQELFRSGVFSWGYDVTPDGRRILAAATFGEEVEVRLVIVQNWFEEFSAP